jgi:hypothetical protein
MNSEQAGAAPDTSTARKGASGLPFELGRHRPKLAGIHCFRLVGNLFPLSVDRPWAGRTRAYGPGTLGIVAVELWSICDRVDGQRLPTCAGEAR